MSFYYEISKRLMRIYLSLPYLEFTRLEIYKKINLIRSEIEYLVLGLIDPILILLLEFSEPEPEYLVGLYQVLFNSTILSIIPCG